MAKRTPQLTVAATPQRPTVHYWAPSRAIEILPEALQRLDMTPVRLDETPNSSLQAALLTQILQLQTLTTAGRRAAAITMAGDFTRMVEKMRAIAVEENAAQRGEINDPFMGRVLK